MLGPVPVYQRRQWHPTPVLFPGKSHGRWSLVGCSPWSLEESDTTERLYFPFSLSCIGERNGIPLQCSCLENPRPGEPGGLPSIGLHRVGHDWSGLAAAAAAKWEPACCPNGTEMLQKKEEKHDWFKGFPFNNQFPINWDWEEYSSRKFGEHVRKYVLDMRWVSERNPSGYVE